MSGAWHGGKGSDPRPEAERGAFSKGFDRIDWNARERAEAAFQKQIKDAGDFAELLQRGPRKDTP